MQTARAQRVEQLGLAAQSVGHFKKVKVRHISGTAVVCGDGADAIVSALAAAALAAADRTASAFAFATCSLSASTLAFAARALIASNL
eukprot:4995415-Prymnesium_polylepis.1